MKNVLTVLISLITHFAQGQGNAWEWQNPKPTGNGLSDVQFVDSLVGWAVGQAGTILKTTDGGQHWIIQSQSSNYLDRVHFLDHQIGWALGNHGVVFRTVNGGDTWVKSIIDSSHTLVYAHFSDAQNGMAVEWNGRVFRTQDGGANWIIYSDPIPEFSFYGFYSAYFVDPLTGWGVGAQGWIYKTTNGGLSWTQQTSGTFETLTSVYFLNSMVGWAVGTFGLILKTQNGGETWESHPSPSTAHFEHVKFIDGQNGWIAGFFKLFRTTNGGVTWTSATVGGAYEYQIMGFDFITPEMGWIVSPEGGVAKTLNGGANWQMLSFGNTGFLRSQFFLNSQYGWAVGNNGLIMRTKNGGRVWAWQKIQGSGDLYAVHFSDTLNGWVFTNGYTYKTTDGGITWNFKPGVSGARDGLFIDSQNGWAVGNGLYRSTDAGESWTSQLSGHKLNSIYFFNSQTGWAVGDSGTIIRTTDGGDAWNIVQTGNEDYYTSVHFVDENTGWIGSLNRGILHTSDGGVTWEGINSGTRTIHCVFFQSGQVGWAVGDADTVIKTIDAGSTWIKQPTLSFTWCKSIFFTDSLNGWLVGGLAGTILHTSTGGLTPIHKTIVSSPTFSLYPNPASETIQLKAASPILSTTITDALGRDCNPPTPDLSAVVEGGANTTPLDVSGLKAGLYWVKIQTKDGLSVQKFIKD